MSLAEWEGEELDDPVFSLGGEFDSELHAFATTICAAAERRGLCCAGPAYDTGWEWVGYDVLIHPCGLDRTGHGILGRVAVVAETAPVLPVAPGSTPRLVATGRIGFDLYFVAPNFHTMFEAQTEAGAKLEGKWVEPARAGALFREFVAANPPDAVIDLAVAAMRVRGEGVSKRPRPKEMKRRLLKR